MKAHNFLFDFVPKELPDIKKKSLKYELELTATLGMLCTLDNI
jgi:hypothetical protein